MKNHIQMAALVFGVALTAMTACKKEDVKNVVAASTAETEMVSLIDQANNDMLAEDANADAPEMGINMVDEGIAADYLVVESDFSDDLTPASGNDDSTEKSMRDFTRARSFVACLRKLDLSDRQKLAIKKNLKDYEDCKSSAVQRARAIYAKLKAAYKEKADRIIAAFRNGDLTKDQFAAKIKALRLSFNKELRSLQLQDKVHEAFKKCYRTYLENLKDILTEKQWKAFVMCHKR